MATESQFYQAPSKFFAPDTGSAPGAYVYNDYPGGQFVKPVLGDFTYTYVTAAGATVTADDYGLVMRQPPTGLPQLAFAYQAAPAAPYTVTASFQRVGVNRDPMIGFRDSTSGRLVTQIFFDIPYALYVTRHDNLTTFSGDYFAPGVVPSALDPTMWVRIRDDGTNIQFFLSPNGLDFVQVVSAAKAGYLTAPDQIGWGTICLSGPEATIKLISWEVS